MTIHRVIPAVIALILMAGCASMVSTKKELQNLSENEGVVIGSVLIDVMEGNESGWGTKAGETDWWVFIQEAGNKLFATTHRIRAKPGNEEFFIKKLPAGSYNVFQAQPAGLSVQNLFQPNPNLRNLYLRLGVNFEVKPRQTSYIGKLAVKFPYRIALGSHVRVDILDAQDETIEKLRAEHSSVLENTVKDLATLMR